MVRFLNQGEGIGLAYDTRLANHGTTIRLTPDARLLSDRFNLLPAVQFRLPHFRRNHGASQTPIYFRRQQLIIPLSHGVMNETPDRGGEVEQVSCRIAVRIGFDGV